MSGSPAENPDLPPGPGPSLGRGPVIVHRSAGRRRFRRVAAVVLVVALVLGGGIYLERFAPPARPGTAGSCPTGVILQGEGASFLAPLESVWNTGYEGAGANRINYNAAGSGAGISALAAPSVDFTATDEPLTAAEYRSMPGVVLTLPVTAGALAVIYNLPGVLAPVQLSGTVLAEVYLGGISNWNASEIRALNPGVALPNATILTVHRSDAAGTTYLLTNYLSEESANWSAGPGTGIQPSWPAAPEQQAQQGNSKLVQYVARTSYSIGYADLTDVLDTPGLQVAKMENPAGRFLLPTLADTASAIVDLSRNTTFPSPAASWTNVSMVNSPVPSDYPLATFAYFLVFQHVEQGFQPTFVKAQALSEWLDFVVGAGQNDSAALHYVPIPANVAGLDDSAIASMTFDGRSVACVPR